MDDNGFKETHALHNMREALTCANVEIEGIKKELDAMTADRDRFAKLSEEWALKGVRMSHKIMELSADRDRWKAQCQKPSVETAMGKFDDEF